MSQHAPDRPASCSNCSFVHLSLRPQNCWEGVIPANLKQLIGWLKSYDYRKQQLQKLIAEKQLSLTKASAELTRCQQALGELNGSSEQAQQIIEDAISAEKERILAAATAEATTEHEGNIGRIAQHILDEVTFGFEHFGQDSPIPNDSRFKRTAHGNLFIGAGNIITAIREAAWFKSGNPGLKRRLDKKLWIRPAKVVILREQGLQLKPLKRADGRNERHIPPEPPGPANMFRAKPATMKFAEKVDYPAHLQFYLWSDPTVALDDLRYYLEVLGELGIMGFHQYHEGQFDIVTFRPASAEEATELVRHEGQRRAELAMAGQ